MDINARIYVAGHTGMVGSAIVRRLRSLGYRNLILRGRTDLDLVRQADVERFFASTPIDQVYVAAAKVGGIVANASAQADFLYENLLISANVIHAAAATGVGKLLFLGSSCIYPRAAPQPLQEESLLTGALEPTNEGYALAKIAGLKLCEKYRLQKGCDFITAMPTNLYGPGDNFHPEHSHVVAGLLRRFHAAKVEGASSVPVWGSGTPRREFLHVDDLAEACVLLMDRYSDAPPVNVGTGTDCTIAEFADLVRKVVAGTFTLRFDPSKPDGTPVKRLDVSRIENLGFKPKIPLERGLRDVYAWAQRTGILTSAAETR